MTEYTLNGTTVTLRKENGITNIVITTDDANVVVNGETIWSCYDDPAYKEVPLVLRPFFKERSSYLGKGEGKDALCADLHLKDSTVTATFFLPKNNREAIVARLDFITSMVELEQDYLRNNTKIAADKKADALVLEFQSLYQNIEDAVTRAGYRLRPSHGSGDFLHAWWDVSFTLDKWNEPAFLAIWRAFDNFDKRLSEVMDMYGHG